MTMGVTLNELREAKGAGSPTRPETQGNTWAGVLTHGARGGKSFSPDFPENPRVGGSIPSPATISLLYFRPPSAFFQSRNTSRSNPSGYQR